MSIPFYSDVLLKGKTSVGYDYFTALARLDIAGGITSLPSVRIGVGTLTNIPVSGAIENDGINLYWTDTNGIRNPLITASNYNGYVTSVLQASRLTTGRLIGIGGAITVPAHEFTGESDLLLQASHVNADYLEGLIPFNTLPVGTSNDTIAIGDHNHDSTYLKLSGGTMTGDIVLPRNKCIIQNQLDTTNYTVPLRWYKGGVSQATNDPHIGQHNTGGGDAQGNRKGTICILPYAAETDPWSGSVGLFIKYNEAKLDGNVLLTAGNYTSYAASSSHNHSITDLYNGVPDITAGRILISGTGGSGYPTWLDKGTNGQFLSQVDGAATWVNVPTADTVTTSLDTTNELYLIGIKSDSLTSLKYNTNVKIKNEDLLLSGSIKIKADNKNHYLHFDETAASWRIGYEGTGSGNANYLVFESTQSTASTWAKALQFGCYTLDATFYADILPAVTNTRNLGSTSLKWANVYATTFTGNLSGNAASADSAIVSLQASRLVAGRLVGLGGGVVAPAVSFSGESDLILDITHVNADYLVGLVPVDVLPVGPGSDEIAAGNHTHLYAGSATAGGPASTVSTASDSGNILYLTGVKSDSLTALKYNSLVTISGGNLSLNSGNITIECGNTDHYLTYHYTGYTTLYSWRIGYEGTGSGDANYLVFETGHSDESWKKVIRFGATTYNATFYANVLPNTTGQNLGSTDSRWSNVYASAGSFSSTLSVTSTVTLSVLTTAGFVKTSSSGVLSSAASVSLSSDVSGTLPATKGGTGLSTFNAGSTFYASAKDTFSALAGGSAGDLYVYSGSAPVWKSIADAGVAAASHTHNLADLPKQAAGTLYVGNGVASSITTLGIGNGGDMLSVKSDKSGLQWQAIRKTDIIELNSPSTTKGSPSTITPVKGNDTIYHVQCSANHDDVTLYVNLPAIDTMSTGDKLEFNLTVIAGTYTALLIFNPNDTTNIFRLGNDLIKGNSERIKIGTGESIIFRALHHGDSRLTWRAQRYIEMEL